MKILPIVAMVTVGFLPLSFPATAATIHVPDEQLTIQAGIDAASYGDTVLVASGTYYEHTITMKSGVYLTSETGHADCVTIDAQQQGRVFYCDGVDGLASIVGFTVTGGTSDLSWGGGMYCRQSSPTLTNCTFSGNRARYGGGMYCRESSSPTLTGCTFSDNEGNWGGGGGMACANSSPTLTNCTFSGNDAAEYGGGMYCTYSSPTLTGCTFSSNYSHYEGGGLCCYYSAPTLTECTLSNNDAAQRGGGMHCWYSSPAPAGCTFSGNGANVGGGMYCREDSSSPTLTDCIIAFSTQGQAIYCTDASGTTLTCCDVYGNTGGDWVGCIAGQFGADGNICEDPLFCGDASPFEPFTLHANSPCAAENNPECGLVGAWDIGCGSTAVDAISWGSIKATFR